MKDPKEKNRLQLTIRNRRTDALLKVLRILRICAEYMVRERLESKNDYFHPASCVICGGGSISGAEARAK